MAAFATPPPPKKKVWKSIVVTGANKGQGLALVKRILRDRDDTRAILCSRDLQRGEEAAQSLRNEFSIDDRRLQVVQLDVTSESSVLAAVESVRAGLDGGEEESSSGLYGVVNNAGILWGYELSELMDVCATGVKRVCDEFLPLLCKEDGRLIVVSSGLGPLMHGYSSQERQHALMTCTSWDDIIEPMIKECLNAYYYNNDDDDDESTTSSSGTTVEQQRAQRMEEIGFPGGPFAESAPDFHMYGLAKMFGDAYMKCLATKHLNLKINSCDPGLVYTDLILKMPRYEGMSREDTNGAQTPEEGVEAAMRLLFDNNNNNNDGDQKSGKFYAMSKDKTELLHSDINKMPNK
jgi:NAD(P)-dependent dehydrogenase (short-subunit alcohol dehydrogenase family)